MKKTLFVTLALLVFALAVPTVASAQGQSKSKCPTCGKSYSECPYKFVHPSQSISTSNKGKQQSTSKKNSTSGKGTGGHQKSKNASGKKDNRDATDARNVTKPMKEEPVKQKPVERPVKKTEPEEVFRSVDQMPQFPGGDAALMKYLSSHIQYPAMAAENNVQGKVILQFVVEKDGSVGEVKVARSVDKDLDKEAVRVVKTLPRFTPGRQNGQVVRVWYTLPVTFKLKYDATSLGCDFVELSTKEKEDLDLRNGVKVVGINPGKFKNAGIRDGFIITDINNYIVNSLEDVDNIYNKIMFSSEIDKVMFITGYYSRGKKVYYAVDLGD